MSVMKKVTQEHFFAVIGPQNVVPCPRNVRSTDPDAGSDYKTPDGRIVGRTINRGDTPHYKPHRDYYLPDEGV